MRSERPIHLDVGVPSGNAFEAQPDTAGHGDTRSQQQLADQGRTLRNLLGEQRGAADTPAGAPVASPFDLFHAAARAPQAEPAAELAPMLEQLARRLLVGDGSQGRRSVLIQLDDPQLPGVTVDIFEEAGRLVARFICSEEDARQRLRAGARWFANSLAQRLQRDVRVQVQTDDPEDPCLLQFDADA